MVDSIHRYSLPLMELFAVCSTSVAGRSHPLRQENKGVEPHGFRADYLVGFT